jgi:hypothetical protein
MNRKDSEANGPVLIEALSQHLPRESEEKQEKSQPGLLLTALVKEIRILERLTLLDRPLLRRASMSLEKPWLGHAANVN